MMLLKSYEQFSTCSFMPLNQTSGALGGKTVSETSEPASADFTATLTIPAQSVAASELLTVTRNAVRASVTIDSWGGGGAVLNYRLKKDGTSISTGTFATGSATGAKAIAVDVTSGALTGSSVFTLYLWVDAGTCVISACDIQDGVGTSQVLDATALKSYITFKTPGLYSITLFVMRIGSGTGTGWLMPSLSTNSNFRLNAMGTITTGTSVHIPAIVLMENDYLSGYMGATGGDMFLMYGIVLNRRRVL